MSNRSMDNSGKKRKKTNIRFLLLAFLGLSILLYPTISSRWNAYRASKLVAKYHEVSDQLPDENIAEYKSKARAYNKTLLGNVVPDSFSVHKEERNEEYEGYLNVASDGLMGSIEIPCIDVDIPVYHYTTDEVLQKGAGHLLGSSLPIGGESTHAVISAHRGLPSAKLFSDLNLVKIGDVFYLHVLDEILAYETDQIQVVEPTETDSLAIVKGEDYTTLVTCTPYAVNTQRLLVRGHRIPYSQESYQEQMQQPVRQNTGYLMGQMICVVAGIAISAFIVFCISRLDKRKRNKEEESIEKEAVETTE